VVFVERSSLGSDGFEVGIGESSRIVSVLEDYHILYILQTCIASFMTVNVSYESRYYIL
jgi:hypothetical protein